MRELRGVNGQGARISAMGRGGDPPHRLLRKCGVGIALMEGVRLVSGGGCPPLPGKRQSVSRAELFAIVLVASQVKDEEVLVWTDSDYVASGFAAGRRKIHDTHDDLWSRLWPLVIPRSSPFRVQWTKAHFDGGSSLAEKYINFPLLRRNST